MISVGIAEQRISPEDGDIFVLPSDASHEQAKQLVEAIQAAKPGVRIVVVRGDIQRLDEAAMNRAGWYRK